MDTKKIATLIKETVKSQTGRNLKQAAALELAAKIQGAKTYNHAVAAEKDTSDPYVLVYENGEITVTDPESSFEDAMELDRTCVASKGYSVYITRQNTHLKMKAQVASLIEVVPEERHNRVWLCLCTDHGMIELLAISPEGEDGFEYADDLAQSSGTVCTGIYNLHSLARLMKVDDTAVSGEKAEEPRTRKKADERFTPQDFGFAEGALNLHQALSEVMGRNKERDEGEQGYSLYLANVFLSEPGETPSKEYEIYVAAQGQSDAKANAEEWAEESLERLGSESFSCEYAEKEPVPVRLKATGTGPLEPDDEAAQGTYEVWLTRGYTDLCGAALDAFHNSVGIEDLDSFELEVSTRSGVVLTEVNDYEGYSFSGASQITKLGD